MPESLPKVCGIFLNVCGILSNVRGIFSNVRRVFEEVFGPLTRLRGCLGCLRGSHARHRRRLSRRAVRLTSRESCHASVGGRHAPSSWRLVSLAGRRRWLRGWHRGSRRRRLGSPNVRRGVTHRSGGPSCDGHGVSLREGVTGSHLQTAALALGPDGEKLVVYHLQTGWRSDAGRMGSDLCLASRFRVGRSLARSRMET